MKFKGNANIEFERSNPNGIGIKAIRKQKFKQNLKNRSELRFEYRISNRSEIDRKCYVDSGEIDLIYIEIELNLF